MACPVCGKFGHNNDASRCVSQFELLCWVSSGLLMSSHPCSGDPDGLRVWASGDLAQALSDGSSLAASSAEERDWLQASL